MYATLRTASWREKEDVCFTLLAILGLAEVEDNNDFILIILKHFGKDF